MTTQPIVKFPKKLEPFIREPKRFNILKGGRGGAKSWTVAEFLLLQGMQSKKRILNTREVQNSIAESVHKLYADKIIQNKYPFDVQKTTINCPLTGSNYFFRGLLGHTTMSLKSIEGIDICWVEEAQAVSKKSLDILIPTVRKEDSYFIFTMNPDEEDDPVTVMFDKDDPDVQIIEINYMDNPWCPQILIDEAERSKRKAERTGDWSDYNHVWLGQPVARTAKVFKDYRVEDFDYSGFDNIREGLDWGFATDPFAWVKCHLDLKRMKLYIFDELYLYGHSNQQAFNQVKEKTSGITIIGDSSEPKSISEGQNYGLYLQGAVKGPGSVEHGIKFLQSFEIIIHPNCTNTAIEFKKYSYKEDKNGNVLPQPVDKHNHIIDSLRYALENDSAGISSSGLIC